MTKYCKLSVITIEKNPETLLNILGYITARADMHKEFRSEEFVFEGMIVDEWTKAIQQRQLQLV